MNNRIFSLLFLPYYHHNQFYHILILKARKLTTISYSLLTGYKIKPNYYNDYTIKILNTIYLKYIDLTNIKTLIQKKKPIF